MPMIARFVICLLAICLGPIASHAQEKATPEDRAAIAICLEKAKTDKLGSETCIGAVQKPCLDAPDSQSTLGMKMCAWRETAVWDERLNTAYQAALRGDLGQVEALRDGGKRKLTGADILRDAQRAWIAFRDKKCDAAGLQMEGGSGAGILIGDCYLQETARQALWLEETGQ
ncbi:MAG: lysozyme inhibitor LprI family protein [Beijerinckiaceae bacterium]